MSVSASNSFPLSQKLVVETNLASHIHSSDSRFDVPRINDIIESAAYVSA